MSSSIGVDIATGEGVCQIDGVVYTGEWGQTEENMWYFKLSEPFFPEGWFPIEDVDLCYDDVCVLGWFSGTLGQYSPSPYA